MKAAISRWALEHPPPGSRYVLPLEYPPTAAPGPRYGYGRPPHRRLEAMLAEGDGRYEEVLRGFADYADALHGIPLESSDPLAPRWRNPFLFGIDGVSLYCFTRQRRPRRYVEVGSGYSTLFVNRARRDEELDMELISIDPFPRHDIDAVCDRVVRQPLEVVDLGVFSQLQSGDIVFMDGTHLVFTNSDAVAFFMDVLPELPPGVLVGVHDIHLPDDYPTERHYSEQFLLACMLLGEPDWLRTVLPCWYVSTRPLLAQTALGLTPEGHDSRGVIFWSETRARD